MSGIEANLKNSLITTNRINVSWNRVEFFKRYSILSYYGQKDGKNMAYEKLCDKSCISVAGFRARYDGKASSMRFFILVKRGEEWDIRNIIASENRWIAICVDTLDDYDERLQQRIIASLAVNSLSGTKDKKNKKRMYSNGSLLIYDNNNFLIPWSKHELVCLKIEVSPYLILTAKTTSFTKPRNKDVLLKRNDCVFRVSGEIYGKKWEGQSIRPVVINKENVDDFNLDELYIKGKQFRDKKNTVPYWPYKLENYTNGRLFAISQVMESVNEKFNGIIHFDFKDYKCLNEDSEPSGRKMLELMKDYLSGKSIYIDDKFNVKGSKALKKQFIKEAQLLMDDKLLFSNKQTANDMVLRFCEPKDDKSSKTKYNKFMDRWGSDSIAQHIIYGGNIDGAEATKTIVRRILIEMLVKDCIANGTLPTELVPLLDGWTFFRYKLNQEMVHGCSLTVSDDGHMNYTDYGMSLSLGGANFETFVKEKLMYSDYTKIKGALDYMALVKEGNVFLIIDTDEIPILDVNLIDSLYGKIANKEQEQTKKGPKEIKISIIKRNAEYPKYLRGYVGFNIWKSEGIDGEEDGGYSYISGINKESLKILQNAKMDRMPRVRRIFILHEQHPEIISSQVGDIVKMLKFGFGRWNEMMTYPFPFKFMQEYLDNICETVYGKHWNEITFKGEL